MSDQKFEKPNSKTDIHNNRTEHRGRIWFVIFIVLTILWLVIIFYMSAQPATESSNISSGIGSWLARLFSPDYQSWPPAEWNAHVDFIEHLIRKAAHFTEYSILGILLCVDLSLSTVINKKGIELSGEQTITFGKPNWKRILLYAWIIGTAYSATDEFHQLFVEGRSGELLDVMIDSSGVFIGSLVAVLVGSLTERRKNKTIKPVQ